MSRYWFLLCSARWKRPKAWAWEETKMAARVRRLHVFVCAILRTYRRSCCSGDEDEALLVDGISHGGRICRSRELALFIHHVVHIQISQCQLQFNYFHDEGRWVNSDYRPWPCVFTTQVEPRLSSHDVPLPVLTLQPVAKGCR